MAVSNRSRASANRRRGTPPQTVDATDLLLLPDDRPVGQALALPTRPVATAWLLDVVTVDEDGRIGLGDAVAVHEWGVGVDLVLKRKDAWLHVDEAPRRHQGEVVRLDERKRLSVPLVWRRIQGLATGSRVCIATGSIVGEPAVIITPVATLAAAVEAMAPFV